MGRYLPKAPQLSQAGSPGLSREEAGCRPSSTTQHCGSLEFTCSGRLPDQPAPGLGALPTLGGQLKARLAREDVALSLQPRVGPSSPGARAASLALSMPQGSKVQGRSGRGPVTAPPPGAARQSCPPGTGHGGTRSGQWQLPLQDPQVAVEDPGSLPARAPPAGPHASSPLSRRAVLLPLWESWWWAQALPACSERPAGLVPRLQSHAPPRTFRHGSLPRLAARCPHPKGSPVPAPEWTTASAGSAGTAAGPGLRGQDKGRGGAEGQAGAEAWGLPQTLPSAHGPLCPLCPFPRTVAPPPSRAASRSAHRGGLPLTAQGAWPQI